MRTRRLWLVTLGALGTASLAYVFVMRGVVTSSAQPGEGLGWPLFGVLPLYAFGMWLLTATSSPAAIYVALGGTGSAVGSAYETYVRTHPEVLHSSGFALVNQIGLAADAVASIGFLLMVASFPGGVLEHRWQRVALRFVWLNALIGPATLLVQPYVVLPEYLGVETEPIPNPYAVPALGFLSPFVVGVLLQWWITPALAVVVFYWRGLFGGPALREQLRVMMVAVTCALGTYALWELTIVAGIDETPFGTATTIAVAAAMVALPVAGIHGILRYGAYDIAVADRGRVVLRSATTLITILYLWAVAAPGVLLSDTIPPSTAVLLTAAVAVALLPVRSLLSRALRRAVVGDRDDPLVVLTELGSRLEQAVDVDEVLTRLATAAREGLGATWVRVSLVSPGAHADDAPRAVAGAVEGEAAMGFDLTRGEVVVGRIDAGPPRTGTYNPAALSLLETVARQATTAVANVRLTAALADQLDELTASRARLITAQDAERRKLERDLHDGVQQSVVALIAGLRLARNRLGRGDLRDEELADLQEQARELIADLRELAHGIHPQVLSDGGLVAAIESRAARFPVPLTIDADDAARSRRFGPDVETVAFYTVGEALANIAKHSGATSAHVSLRVVDDELVVEVSDDGVGFVPAPLRVDGPAAQAGLANIHDRVAAATGRVRIESASGSGTRLVVELPLSTPGKPGTPARSASSAGPAATEDAPATEKAPAASEEKATPSTRPGIGSTTAALLGAQEIAGA